MIKYVIEQTNKQLPHTF